MTYRHQKIARRTLNSIAARQGGYFTAKQAEAAGYAYSHLSYHLKAGNFERAGHGLYRIPGLPLAEHDDLIRLSLWSRDQDDRPQAIVSHQTAIELHEIGELIPGETHLTVPPGFRKRAPRGCRLHKHVVPRERTTEMWGVRVTTALQTLEDLAGDRSISIEQFEKAVKEAGKKGLIRRSQVKPLLAERASGNPMTRKKGEVR